MLQVICEVMCYRHLGGYTMNCFAPWRFCAEHKHANNASSQHHGPSCDKGAVCGGGIGVDLQAGRWQPTQARFASLEPILDSSN